MTNGPLFTVGHGTRPLKELVAVLHGAGVELLVDVRRYPGSRRNPQYQRPALEKELPRERVAYEWSGETLGGRRKGANPSRHPAWKNDAFRAYADYMDTDAFVGALDSLLTSARTTPTAVMCAETLWWKCHRRLIADAAIVRDFEVVHVGAGEPVVHHLEPWARIDTELRIVYDAGADQPRLDL